MENLEHPAPAPATTYEERLAALRQHLRGLGSVAVAYSGGVDSSVLLHAAHAELGAAAAGVIADSPSLPRRELTDAVDVAHTIGARIHVVPTDEGDDPGYRANRGDRCYFCKSALFRAMEPWAEAQGFGALAFGEITDDLLDHRPGARAAGEFGVVAPLSAARFSKEDVRRYAREAGLQVADKPSSACLASRLPVGTEVTPERLAQVEAAEEGLRHLGLRQVRVRHHGDRAQVEVGADEIRQARSQAAAVAAVLEAAGFATHDLGIYLTPAEKARARAAATAVPPGAGGDGAGEAS